MTEKQRKILAEFTQWLQKEGFYDEEDILDGGVGGSVGIQEASVFLSLSEGFCKSLVESGELPFHELDGRRWIYLDDIAKYKRSLWL